jgi:O-antigen ligase
MAISMGLGYLMAVSSRAMRGVEGWRNRLLWLSSSEASHILLVGAALAFMALSLVLTASRSGIGSFVAGMLVIAYAALRPHHVEALPPQRRMAMAGYVAALTFVTVIWVGFPVMAARFSYDPEQSVALAGRVVHWRDASAVIQRFPLTGTGLNTFTVVTPFFQSGSTPNSNEAHNDYLQLAAEGGLLVGIPAVALAVVFAREVRRRFRQSRPSLSSHWLRVGAVAGVAAIAVQESVDFSLQLPGNAVLFAALCAVAVHKPEGE